MRKIFTLVTCLFLATTSFAQLSTVRGSITDPNEKKPVQNAVVALLTPKDSVLYKFTRTDSKGKFILKDVTAGEYILMTTHPYFADLLDNVMINNNVEIPEIALISKAKLLQEVIVKTGSPIKIKGDTTVYTADSFKVSANANVEELLKKLPGIQVDKDGKIKAMGETVQKVLVDGEEFFGDDPGMAVKNLRADAVKEVQVFDKKSDQAEFTGIDDGKTQKTINLKLKEDKKTGYFGKMDIAGGAIKNIDPRYNTNLLYSSFKGKRKLSGFFLTGNTGQDGLNWQDEQKYVGSSDNIIMDDDGGIMIFGGGRSSDEEPYLDAQNGFLTNVNAGISYNNKWNDKHTLNFTPKYNSQEYQNHKTSFTQTPIGDSVFNDNADVLTNIRRHNIKTRATYDLKLDSNNSLKITANANFYRTETAESRIASKISSTGTLKNSSDRLLNTNTDKNAFSGNLLFKHRFAKLRRTLSVSADWNALGTDGTNFLQSTNKAYFNGIQSGTQFLNQMKDYETATNNLSAKLVYTEPLSKDYSLELGYQLGYNYGNNNQITYNYSPVTGKFDFKLDSLSNEFKQSIVQNIPSAKVNFANKKLKVNIGAGFGFTNFNLEDITLNKDYTRNYVNYYPTGNITYTYKPNHSVRVNYSGNTSQPSINQLQPLRNNNDYFNQYIGNPNLKPSFSNSVNISHNSYNFIKDIYTYASVYMRTTDNAIVNSRTTDTDSGKTVTQPVNMKGNISISFYGGTGFKIKKIDTRVNISPGVQFSKSPDLTNGKAGSSKTFAPGLSVYMSKAMEKRYDISINDQFNYSSSTTSQNNNKIHYIMNRFGANATVYIKKVWSLINDYEFFSRQKTASFNNGINTHIWNARLQRTFKKDEFTAYISVKDILNQNVGIQRNFYNNIYSEEINDRLKRYFLIGFTWDFKNKSATPAPPTK